jgi:hypothetical protein
LRLFNTLRQVDGGKDIVTADELRSAGERTDLNRVI